MSEEYPREGVEWKVQDVTQMVDIASKTIDVAFDKGTLDSMVDGRGSLVSPSDEVLDMTSRYIREVRNNAINQCNNEGSGPIHAFPYQYLTSTAVSLVIFSC